MKEITFNEFDGLMIPSNSKDMIKEGIITTSNHILHVDIVKKALIEYTTPERVIDNWIAINKEIMFKRDVIEFIKLCIEHNYYFQILNYLIHTNIDEYGTVRMECDLVYEYIEMPCKHPVGGKKIRNNYSNEILDEIIENEYLFGLYKTYIKHNNDYIFNIRDVVINDLEHVTSSNQKVIESYLHKLKKNGGVL